MNKQKRFREIFRFRGDIFPQNSKIGCLRNQRLCGHTFFPNTKKFAKIFLPVHMGPRTNILSKKMFKKSRDTVPLMQMITYSNREQIQHGLLYLTQHQMTKIENILFSLYNLRTFYFIYCQEFANTQFLTM